MTRGALAAFLVWALCVAATPVSAQIGEFHLGAIASYGTGEAYGRGGGLVLGVAPGRIAYVGLRWMYQAGATKLVGPASPPEEVRNRVQVFALDLGVQLPVGRLELVPGVGLGALRFDQRTRQPGGGADPVSAHAMEFLAAPGLSVEIPLATLALIPQVQYALAGHPDLPQPVRHRGLVASLRLVIQRDVARIRH